MWLDRKKPEDKATADRQKVIAFKRFFTGDARGVMIDLMNRFYILNPLPKCDNEFERGRCEGQRDAVLYILGLAHTDMAQFEKILKGEYNG